MEYYKGYSSIPASLAFLELIEQSMDSKSK